MHVSPSSSISSYAVVWSVSAGDSDGSTAREEDEESPTPSATTSKSILRLLWPLRLLLVNWSERSVSVIEPAISDVMELTCVVGLGQARVG